MYITWLNINHLKEVAKLEKQVYPEELCLGYEDYVNDFKSVPRYYNSSMGVFINGELKGYIICYRKDGGNYYISDLVCPNPKLLLPLLITFVGENHGLTCEAEMRYTSYRMVKHIIKKYPGFITKVQEKGKIPGYYPNGEDMYKLKFKINSEPIRENPKFLILREIYSPNCFQVNIKNVLYRLCCDCNISSEEIKKYKSFILRHLHNRNLDALRMVGDTFQFIVYYHCLFRNEEAFNKMKQYLLKKGYTEEEYTEFEKNNKDLKSYNNKFTVIPINYMLWSTSGELEARFKDDTISYYRSHIKRKFINYYKGKPFVKEIVIRDKYDNVWLRVTPHDDVYKLIPRNYSNIFDAKLKHYEFSKNIKNKVMSLFPRADAYMLVSTMGVPALRRVAGEEVAYGYFNRVLEVAKTAKDKTEIFHDWGYIIPEILQYREYLTKGALKHVFLNKSLNQINKIKDTLAGLRIDGIESLDKKQLRRKISMTIKKDEDLTLIVSEIVREAEKAWLRKKRISQNLLEDMLAFVERMKKYFPQVSASMLFQNFGKKAIDMVKGKYEGLFKEKLITMDYKEFGQFILGILDKRTRRNKRLFGALSKIQNIQEIFEGNILPENYDRIVQELKQRNINIPDKFLNLNKFYAKIERKCSPEYLIAGNASVCCMGFGQDNANTYALEKGFGIVNIYYKDRIIANSVIWINQPYRCLVLDNIEVHPNYKKFNDITKKLFEKVITYLLKEYNLDFAVQGAKYNDLTMYEPNTERIRFEVLKPVDVNVKNFYTDAHYVYPLDYNISSQEARNRIDTINMLLRGEKDRENSIEDIDFFGEALAI